jgi:DNA-directed RNA polymerase specialized sigma24 family protein
MRREWAITPEAFEALLAWLEPDREAAGKKYEIIRAGLVKIFIAKGFNDAEDLADQVINRVIDRLPDIRNDYVGEPANYFRGVARNIIHEARRRKEIATDVLPVSVSEVDDTGSEAECLQKCLKLISSEQCDLALEYYLYEGKNKIAHRKRIADELGISVRALRVRAHRIRVVLQKCVLKCLKNLAGEMDNAPQRIIKEVGRQ